jgi:hypothetical protein
MSGANVLVIADNDEPGRRHARQVRDSLLALDPPARVAVFRSALGKDVSEHLAAGLDVNALVRVPECGKTTTGERLARLCRNPVLAASLSSPALLTRQGTADDPD